MVTGKVVDGLTETVSMLSPALLDKLSGMIVLFKALGVVAIIYVSYLIYMGIINFSKRKKLRNIEDKVNLIDEKLDIILNGMKSTGKKFNKSNDEIYEKNKK